MKKTLIFAFLLTSAFFLKSADAQVNVNINIGSQPQWGPVGYNHVDYYYLPDVESYYYVPTRQFVYLQHGRWIFATSLPHKHRGYDLYSGYKVVLNGPRPYHHFHNHKIKYKKYKGYHHKQNAIKYHSGKGKHIAYHPQRNSGPSRSDHAISNYRSSKSYNAIKNTPGRNSKYHKTSSRSEKGKGNGRN